jgi:hypothetical protein
LWLTIKEVIEMGVQTVPLVKEGVMGWTFQMELE